MDDTRFVDPYTEDIISQLAQDETGKRQYYRPIYSLHKWWARRPGSLFRAIILRACAPEETLFTRLENGALATGSGYFADHDLSGVIILDPFMGGGTTLVEANRLGAQVVGCDLNPVSFWVVRETLKPINLQKLESYFSDLERSAGEKIRSLYRTNCTICHTPSDGLYAFWVRCVYCLHCGELVHLYKRTLLNEGLSRNKPPSSANPAVAFCPRCFALNEWPGQGSCVCQSCGEPFDPQSGTYDNGNYSCPHCGQDNISLLRTLRTGQRLREKLVAIEYWCNCRQTRLYKSPDSADMDKLAQIQDAFERQQEQMFFPRQEIMIGASSVRWRQHGYSHYYEIFSPRQLLAFQYLLEEIQAIPEEEYRYALMTVFSNCLEYNNMMTPYNYPHRKLHHLFNYHAMPLTTTPVENAVWGIGTEGAGTFTNCYRRYVRAKQYAGRPFDKFKDATGKIQTSYAKKERIAAHFVSSFEELQRTPRGALLLCGDSSRLPAIPDESVDFVITDPPYFDNVHYSELSNFFYVWLNRLVDHPYFAAEHVPTAAEAIVNGGMAKGEQEYQDLLAAVFKESGRVLKPHGKLIFTFHHTKWMAWWTVLTAIASSGFVVADFFSAMSEYKVNPHIRNKQALDMDLVLVCQKRPEAAGCAALSPEDVLRRVEASLRAGASGDTKNKLFLHFMGELLRTASIAYGTDGVNYEWFAAALSHFDEYQANTVWPQRDSQPSSLPQQLKLFTDFP